jgi:hypothetical protein
VTGSAVREPHPRRAPAFRTRKRVQQQGEGMNYIFWLIGVIVVILAILGFLGLR